MKIRHFASRGNNERYREREDKLPLEVMIPTAGAMFLTRVFAPSSQSARRSRAAATCSKRTKVRQGAAQHAFHHVWSTCQAHFLPKPMIMGLRIVKQEKYAEAQSRRWIEQGCST